jgi:hypothetical protein
MNLVHGEGAATAWREAARHYCGLSQAAQAEYWSRLSPDQRPHLERALEELRQASQAATPSPVAARKGCGGGCLTVLRKGCLTIAAVLLAVVIWSKLPWFKTPSSDRFTLWPDSTRDAMASRVPVDPFLRKKESENPATMTVSFPLPELRRWLGLANIAPTEVTQLTFLNVVADEGGWLFGGEGIDTTVDFKEVTSAIALLELPHSASEVLAGLPASAGARETLREKPVLRFSQPNPPAMQRSKGPLIEDWYVAAPTEHVLAIGGRTAVEHVLAVAASQRPNITVRDVVQPLLAEMEDADELYLTVMSSTQEESIPVVSALVQFLSEVPGISLIYSYRARGNALQHLPNGGCIFTLGFQFEDRLAGRLVSIGMSLLSLLKSDEDKGGEIVVSHADGLARFQILIEPGYCTDDVVKQGL